MKLDISDHTFARLQRLAVPLVDTVENVIVRLLDHYAKDGANPMQAPHSFMNPTSIVKPTGPLGGLQRELWDLVIKPIPTQRFTLQDVYARKAPLAKLRPHVVELDASIRAGLERLRDRGYIQFVDNRGTYRKLQ